MNIVTHKAAKSRGKTLVRKTSTLTLADLERLQAARATNTKRPPSLPLAAIEVAPLVFQWRLAHEDIQADQKLVVDLVAAITRTDNQVSLDPILVTGIGGRYFVVDGHHRLDAYHTAQWSGDVPVEHFEGSLQEATIEAIERNKKNKMPYGDETKREIAWRLLVQGQSDERARHTLARLSEITTVSLRTVKRMSGVLKKYGADVSTLTWANARRTERTAEQKSGDDWKEKRALKLARQLAKCDSLTKNPEITAMALAKLSSHLPKMLIGAWPHVASEMLVERLREQRPADADMVEGVLDAAFSL